MPYKSEIKNLLLICCALVPLCSCSVDRDSVLKVYNWSNYIGEGVIDDFEKWYRNLTGKDISVIYQTFDINETMLSKIEKGHEDFDVVCPSDYMIERMLNSDMLQPIDFASLPDSINYIRNNQSSYITGIFRRINPAIDANDYSVAYMWGTTGILYNRGKVRDEDAATWDILRNPAYAGKIFIKDAPRDVYGPIIIYLKNKELAAGELTLDDLMKDSSQENVDAVEAYMQQVKQGVAGWEADFGKEQMTQERGYVSLNWSGDALWAIEEAAEIGVDLAYVVPKEGSNIWFDGWVIPKYAENVMAATLFIDFMCRPDIAVRNMEETGYVSANGDLSVLKSHIDGDYDPIDLSYFFGPEASSVRVNPALYPDKSTIEHCALMHDWGDNRDRLISMWSRIKGENADYMTLIVIGVAAAAATGFGIRSKVKKSSRRKHRRYRK